jgi:bacterioferritin-associated ferredoxin
LYVCFCNGLTERDIRAAARAGAVSVEDAYRRLGGEPVCRCCIEAAEAVIEGETMGARAIADAA